MAEEKTIAIIGGTGKLGAAIAGRLAWAGREVLIGSRTRENAEAAAGKLKGKITGLDNAAAASAASIVIVTVPFAAQEATLTEIAPHLAGKILVDTTVPLVPPKVMRVQLPPEGSAAERAQRLVGKDVRVVSAFHNVAAHRLATDEAIECDVLVFGDDKDARAEVVQIVRDTGLRGIHGGALVNSAAAEALTSVLIFINKAYAIDGAGLVITGQLTERDG